MRDLVLHERIARPDLAPVVGSEVAPAAILVRQGERLPDIAFLDGYRALPAGELNLPLQDERLLHQLAAAAARRTGRFQLAGRYARLALDAARRCGSSEECAFALLGVAAAASMAHDFRAADRVLEQVVFEYGLEGESTNQYRLEVTRRHLLAGDAPITYASANMLIERLVGAGFGRPNTAVAELQLGEASLLMQDYDRAYPSLLRAIMSFAEQEHVVGLAAVSESAGSFVSELYSLPDTRLLGGLLREARLAGRRGVASPRDITVRAGDAATSAYVWYLLHVAPARIRYQEGELLNRLVS